MEGKDLTGQSDRDEGPKSLRLQDLSAGLGVATTLFLVATSDFLTGYRVEFFVFYAIPVAWATWRLGRRTGILVSLAAAALWYGLDLRLSPPDAHWAFGLWGAVMKLLAYLMMVIGADRIQALLRQERAITHDLADALAEVRVLKDLLPICAWCKRIRDDEGYWRQFESYISAHTHTRFTHSICPTCQTKLRNEMAGPDQSTGESR